MKLKLIATTFALACIYTSATLAEDAAPAAAQPQGQSKVATCAACHGIDGNSVNPEWPSLAGQNAQYIAKQLHLFKSGKRQSATMLPVAQALSDQDINDVANYYSTQTLHGLETEKSKVALGERIYRGGIAATNVPACLACHGPDGRGNLPANYPALHGQNAAYIIAQLNAYKTGQRATDINKIMRDVAASLSTEEIAAVASYVQGIR